MTPKTWRYFGCYGWRDNIASMYNKATCHGGVASTIQRKYRKTNLPSMCQVACMRIECSAFTLYLGLALSLVGWRMKSFSFIGDIITDNKRTIPEKLRIRHLWNAFLMRFEQTVYSGYSGTQIEHLHWTRQVMPIGEITDTMWVWSIELRCEENAIYEIFQ